MRRVAPLHLLGLASLLVGLAACTGDLGAPDATGATSATSGSGGASTSSSGQGGATSAQGGGGGAGATTSHGGGSSAGGAGGGGAPACPGADVVVAPDGAGDACSCVSPCALEAGRDRARTLAAAASADVIVAVTGGVYRLAHTFRLGVADSGQGGHAIVYRAAEGARPVWSGGVRVTGFAPVASLPGTWVAPVPAGTHARQLWVDGRRATRARGPSGPAGFAKTATGFTLGDPAMAAWPDRAGLEVVGTQAWKMFRCPVSDVSAGGLTVAAPCWASSQAQQGVTFDEVGWVENALELLDEGGEFHLDDAGGLLFYRPRDGEDLAQADVELPVVEELVRIEGTPAEPAHDVNFEGITFSHATWTRPSAPDGYASLQAGITPVGSPPVHVKPLANVTVHAAHHVRFHGCTFAHLGGIGLALEVGAHDDVVDASRFEDISASAVMIGDVTHEEDHHPADPALVVRDNTIQGSYVTRAGAEYFDTPGIFGGYTTHTTLAQNELFDLPYTGISLGWGWGSTDVGGSIGYATPTTSREADVRGNVVGHHMRRLRDGGAIYVLGDQPGSTMTGNVIDNQGAPFGNLYLDNGSQHWSLTDNVVFVHPKSDGGGDGSTWLYVQVYPTKATNNSIARSYTTDPTIYAPQPIPPSNSVEPPTVIGLGPSPADPILAAAGSPLRSPNVAVGKAATASSAYAAAYTADHAADGSAFDGWSPSGDDPSPWWQLDLGAAYAIDGFEVVSRWALDQPVTRRSYRVVASADAAFTAPVVLGAVDATGLPHRAIFAGDVAPPVVARYVRVEKTAAEYFFLGEVRVRGRPSP
jgi:hypothetical protein